MKSDVVVIDTGVSNITNILSLLDHVNVKFDITDSNFSFKNYNKIILPGVGNFGKFVQNLNDSNLINPIKDFINEGKFLLGICSGMQFLFEGSEEAPGVSGLGVIKGKLKKFNRLEVSGKVPLIGKRVIHVSKKFQDENILLKLNNEKFYFLHSYYCSAESNIELCYSYYNSFKFSSGVKAGNIYGFQFHPEKSGKVGIDLFKNFIKL